jgi:phosphohistidine phosphatase SixA
MSTNKARLAGAVLAAAAAAAAVWPAADAQELQGDALAAALREGGYVIVMRHASSPREKPTTNVAPGNVERERQLDQPGLDSAAAMGKELERLRIPIGEVLSSPTFRALQTVRQLHVGNATAVPELGDGGEGMRADTEGKRSAWLRAKAAEAPPARTNRLLITHLPNLAGAFGAAAEGMTDGESLIFKPGGGDPRVVARVKISDWASLGR